MFYPDFEGACALAKEYNTIPVTTEFYADMDTPISVFQRLQTDRFCFLLESADGSKNTRARYSFIGRSPFLTLKAYGRDIHLTDCRGHTVRLTGDPLEELRRQCEKYRSPVLPGIPAFSGGSVGYFAYDVIRLTEHLPHVPQDDLKVPDLHFLFTDELVVFDHLKQKLVLVVNMHTDLDLRLQYERAVKRLIEIQGELSAAPSPLRRGAADYRRPSHPKSNLTKEQFCGMVEKAKEYIKNGDIFQVVLSQRFETRFDCSPFSAYRAIRLINPSPYMYYLKFDHYAIAGASPELLVKAEDGTVRTSPIAGTRKRGKTPEEDGALEQSLLADQKENAEHTMLVDLGRNDIGKVSEFGSVQVSRFKYVQRFSHVMHLTSDVSGRLRKGLTPFDALRSVLPAGTLSGAPKIRAMEIIDRLEPTKRCTYGGAIGYIGFNGSLDSCITIRTALFCGGKAYVQAGGGIVADSVPENEYEESVNKSMAMLKAIEKAGDLQCF